MLRRIALWGPSLIAALLLGTYIWVHRPFAVDETELVAVPLNADDPEARRWGDLTYRGGLDIPRMDQNIGGLSGLRWDAESGRMLAITDDARWVWLTLEEQGETLTGIAAVETGPLLGLGGEVLTGKKQGDSESLTRSSDGGWLIGFERNHRLLRYPNLAARPEAASVNPVTALAPMAENNGLETLAGDETSLFACAERAPQESRANCLWRRPDIANSDFALEAVPAIAPAGAVPTDADRGEDGTIYVLFRSYAPGDGNKVGITALRPDGSRRDLLVLTAPFTVDNFEGLAVREEGDRTFLYIVSDDNFSGNQRTLLMKFEILRTMQVGGG